MSAQFSKGKLGCSVSLVASAGAFLFPATAAAQLAENAEEQPSPEIVVTGSRVERPGFSAPTPMVVLGEQDLDRRNATTVADVLNEIPSFRPGQSTTTSNQNIEGRGQVFADLRGLGGIRTLVLTDSRRMVPTNSRGQVDLNFIPTVLVKRMDVVTGGASAAWGSDAVAGVVNILLKHDLEGFEGDVTYGQSRYGDDETYRLGLAYGLALNGGRTHFLVGGEYSNNKGVGDVYSREWGREERGTIANPGFATNGLPATIYARNVRLATAVSGGIITAGPLRGTAFRPDGTPYAFNYGQVYGNNMIGGGDEDARDIFGENLPLKVPVERYNILTRFSHEFSDSLSGFVQAAYGWNRNSAPGAPVGRDQGTLTISVDNAFLPEPIRAQMQTLGLTSFAFGRNSTDLGSAIYSNENSTYGVTVGFEGKIGSRWKWDGYFQFGENDYRQVVANNRIEDRFRRALDARLIGGQIVCNPALAPYPGDTEPCIPLNLFGEGNFSAEARDYILGTMIYDQTTSQVNAAFNVNGDPFSTWAGPVSIAAGLEYREDSINAESDPLSRARRFRFGNPQPIRGAVEIFEAYGEVVVPLLKDHPFGRSLDLNGAIRQTHYSTSGWVTTWKVGATYEPFDDLRLRVTRSQDIRAPNATELFSSSSSSTLNIRDPLNGIAGQTHIDAVGNPLLQPERAATFTFGAVLQPRFLPRLRISLDYYDIDIQDTISSLQPQMIVDRCFSGATDLCEYVVRDPVTNRITSIINPLLNLNRFHTRGLDIEADYNVRAFGGTVSLRALATRVFEHTTVDSAGAVDRVGETGGVGVPKWTATGILGYNDARFSLFGQVRYISPGTIENTTTETGTLSRNINTIPARAYTSFSASYALMSDGPRKLQVHASVDNLFDVDPPFPIGAIFASNGVYYDPIGTTFKFGIRFAY